MTETLAPTETERAIAEWLNGPLMAAARKLVPDHLAEMWDAAIRGSFIAGMATATARCEREGHVAAPAVSPAALEAARRLAQRLQTPASLMGGEAAILNISDVDTVARELLRIGGET